MSPPQRDKAILLEKHGLLCHDIALALLRLFPFLICTEGRQRNLSSLGPTQPFGEIYFRTCRVMSSTWLIPEQNQIMPAAEPPKSYSLPYAGTLTKTFLLFHIHMYRKARPAGNILVGRGFAGSNIHTKCRHGFRLCFIFLFLCMLEINILGL